MVLAENQWSSFKLRSTLSHDRSISFFMGFMTQPFNMTLVTFSEPVTKGFLSFAKNFIPSPNHLATT